MVKFYCKYCNFRSIRKQILDEHSKKCKFLDVENKLLIIPFYKDLKKINSWKYIIKNCNFLIYEKDDNIPINKIIKKSDNHIKISSIGEGTFQFLHYVVNNYHNLPNFIIYTKSHWIPRFSDYFSFLDDFNKKNILYYQHQTRVRKFISCFNIENFLNNVEKYDNNFFKKYELNYKFFNSKDLLYILKKRNIFKWKFYLEYNKDLTKAGLKTETDAYNHYKKYGKKEYRAINKLSLTKDIIETEFDESFKPFDSTNLDSSYFSNGYITKQMKHFFDDFEPTLDFKCYYREGSFTVHKNIIRYHSLETWKKFFDAYINFHSHGRDEIVIFIDMLFKETVRRYNKRSKSSF